jgi:hypothetical protein
MASRTLRRRLHHGDVDGKRNEHLEGSLGLDGLDEPLLGNYEHDDRHSEVRLSLVILDILCFDGLWTIGNFWYLALW